MRRPLRQNPARRQTAIARQIPAPVGGWDTESPLAAMKPTRAVILDNWIPRAGYVEMRRGYVEQVTGTEEPVEALLAWRGDAQGDKLFACSGADIFDVTTAGPLGSAVYSTSGSAYSARYKHTNFANDAGAFLLACNGLTTPIRFDGSAFSTLSITASASSFTANDLADVMSHKRRLFWLQRGSLTVWYLGVNAIQGAASPLPLGGYFYKGGELVAQATWSLDGGQGLDDMAVFVTSEGQVAIFQGTDPSDASKWLLVGVFDLAKPIGTKPLIKWGGDLVVLTEDGVVPLSQALDKDRAQDDRVALTANIATAFSTAAMSYGANHGWCGFLYPGRGSLAIFNVPTVEGESADQYVQSIQTGAWCRFTGIPATCWELANGRPYFGSAAGVYQWDTGASDNGEPIVSDVKPAFNAFGNQQVRKNFTMIQALLKAPANLAPALEVLTDYQERVPTAVPTIITPGDIEAGDADAIRQDWTGATGAGYVAAPRMRIPLQGLGESDVLAVDATDLLEIESGTGDNLLTFPDLPLDVEIQCIGFGVVFQPGGVL